MPSFIIRNVNGVISVWHRSYPRSPDIFPTSAKILNPQNIEMNKEYDWERLTLFMLTPDALKFLRVCWYIFK